MARTLHLTIAGLISLLATTGSASAQLSRVVTAGPGKLLGREEEIALARSAAPPAVIESASIYVLTKDGYNLAVAGSNGAACYVSRDWLIWLEPHCFDAEGAATIMKTHMRKVELLHAGAGVQEMNDIVMDELPRGEFRLPRRPAMSWMMSSAPQLVSDSGRPVGAWKPHIMLYYPFLGAAELSLPETPSAPSSTMIAGGGSPLSTLVIVVPDFVDPAISAASAP